MAHYQLRSKIGVISISGGISNPLNQITNAVRSAIFDGLDKGTRDNAAAIIVTGQGASFSHGSSALETLKGKSFAAPSLISLTNKLENFHIPVICGFHGSSLGSGLELALGCHWRLADACANMGFTDLNHGLITGI